MRRSRAPSSPSATAANSKVMSSEEDMENQYSLALRGTDRFPSDFTRHFQEIKMVTPYRFESTSAASAPERQIAFTSEDVGLIFTHHAKQRMSQRRIPVEAVCAALDYGHVYRTRGAVIYGLNRRASDQCKKDGL